MKKNYFYFIAGVLSASVVGIIIAAVDQPATAATTGVDPVYTTSTGTNLSGNWIEHTPTMLPDSADAEMLIVVGKGGKMDFVGANNTTLRKYHIGEKRPVDIETLLPNEKIKTLDQITILSGSPACIIRDGYIICS